MRLERPQLAWIILLTGFVTFLCIMIALPLSIRSIINNATIPKEFTILASQGTVGVSHSNGTTALFAGDHVLLKGEATILTNALDSGLIEIPQVNAEQVGARLQIYGGTQVTIERATAVRFVRFSDQTDRLVIHLTNGRLRLVVPPQKDRLMQITVTTAQGRAQIVEPGSYSFLAQNDQTNMTVTEGESLLLAGETIIHLHSGERAVIPVQGEPEGPLHSAPNLIQNGSFQDSFAYWIGLSWNIERSDQPSGVTDVVNRDAPRLLFERDGFGHADTGVRQIINQDITDYQALQLILGLEIQKQSLEVCGIHGSECPLLVRIEYETINGEQRTWQQGFYATGTITANTPDICISCVPPRTEHYRIPLGQLFYYESSNLIELLTIDNVPPRLIKNISLVAAGHTFEVELIEISLLATE